MFGNTLLVFGLFASLFTIIMYYLNIKGYKNTLVPARLGFNFTALSIIGASALLLHAVLTHQYQYKYIFNYSGSDLPIGLLISTFYAGQEGSLMIWLLFAAIVGLVLLDYTAKRGDLEARTMMIYSFTLTFLLVMVNPLLKSPFEYIWSEPTFINLKYLNQNLFSLPFLQQHFFEDPNSGDGFIRMSRELFATLKAEGYALNDFIVQGKGLNPLLQNFWMQIHPPLLFVGFAMCAVPFSFSIAALIKNEYNDWVKQSLPWTLAGTMVLGLAIMLGGYWAYGVLGWGGYWGWDPVENSSLVPWMIGVAAIHTMLVQKKHQRNGFAGRLVKTNLLLSVLMFVLVLYSTFLTRSGILSDASVHSFVAPGKIVFIFLLGFLLVFLFIGIGGIIYRWKYLSEKYDYEENILSRELALFTGSVTIIGSAIIILLGTSAPIWGDAVEIRFYNELNLPIAIIIGILNGLSLLLKWQTTNGKTLWNSSKLSVLMTAVFSALIIYFGNVTDVMLIVFTISSTFALIVNLEITVKIIKSRISYTGAYVSHIGIALFLLGVIATGGFSDEKQIELPKGKSASVLGYNLKFIGYEPFENNTKYRFKIEVEKGDSKSVIAPVMYIAEFNNSLMREPDIMNYITRDFYVEPLSYSDGRSNANKEHNHGKEVPFKKGDLFNIGGYDIRFEEFEFPQESMNAMMSGTGFEIHAIFSVLQNSQFVKNIKLTMKSTDGQREYVPFFDKETDLHLRLTSLDASGSVSLSIIDHEHTDNKKTENISTNEVLTIQASLKPFINLVWAGVIVMVLGFLISTIRRTIEARQ